VRSDATHVFTTSLLSEGLTAYAARDGPFLAPPAGTICKLAMCTVTQAV
jgi:hypothetical protein